MMDFDAVKKYWEERASVDSSAQSTTQDFYLREIEFNVLSERVKKYSPKRVADIGCGDGRTTSRLANANPTCCFFGFDYSSSMISNAKVFSRSIELSNVEFDFFDIINSLNSKYDLIYTTRCLINIPSWDLQKLALDNICKALNSGGMYLMIENFIEGQDSFNKVRRDFGLPEIAVREHNYFFQRDRFLDYACGRFEIEEEVNISSTYYMMSRVVYSKICADKNHQPDYLDDHHRFAAGLPFSGEFGPVRLVCLKKL